MSTEPFVLQPGEGRAIDLGGFLMTVKATSESTGNAFTLLEAAEPPNFGPPMHVHRDAAEAFYVLEGEYSSLRSRSDTAWTSSDRYPRVMCKHHKHVSRRQR